MLEAINVLSYYFLLGVCALLLVAVEALFVVWLCELERLDAFVFGGLHLLGGGLAIWTFLAPPASTALFWGTFIFGAGFWLLSLMFMAVFAVLHFRQTMSDLFDGC